MEIYSTEEQQAEAIKRFFRENGVSLALGIVLGLGGLYGWKAYNAHQIDVADKASNAFNTFVESEDALAKSDAFIADNSGSNYAVLAAFVAAKEAVEQKQLDKAAEKLTWAAENVKNEELKATALLRLARVQAALGQADVAFATLEQKMPEGFAAQVAEIKGDIKLSLGDEAAARAAYQQAVDKGGLDNNPTLQTKLDNLAQAAN
ncbi:YfgM family protein [Pseudoalteromonas xiamenensis]|uniref:Ancillary SecYEG translocon subunit n=1 Tax=Pseudoalteromonas xiamenensis TaxID=882626 RepID=A0A975DJ75_9GAMM|nr:tetratricopeptide repeat protein [Pseudoalteromonas xiamenensis]QTH72529.1 tetratricopeptide repeat protein [Pseudoalteromonas xiamenensis]